MRWDGSPAVQTQELYIRIYGRGLTFQMSMEGRGGGGVLTSLKTMSRVGEGVI